MPRKCQKTRRKEGLQQSYSCFYWCRHVAWPHSSSPSDQCPNPVTEGQKHKQELQESPTVLPCSSAETWITRGLPFFLPFWFFSWLPAAFLDTPPMTTSLHQVLILKTPSHSSAELRLSHKWSSICQIHKFTTCFNFYLLKKKKKSLVMKSHVHNRKAFKWTKVKLLLLKPWSPMLYTKI